MIFTENMSSINALGDLNPTLPTTINSSGVTVVDLTNQVTVKAIAKSTIANNRPVQLYLDENGNLKCIATAIDNSTSEGSNPLYFGIVEVGGATGDVLDVIVQGHATVASGGTTGNMLTSINDNGEIGDSTPGAMNQVLGVVLDTDKIYI